MPHLFFSCGMLAGSARSQALLPATGPAHPHPTSRACSGGSVGGVRPQLLPPLLLGTPHVVCHPPPRESTMPSTWNQRLCDISPGAKGTTGNASARVLPVQSAAALVVTSPRFLQLPRATGSDEFAPPPRLAGPVLACARHMGQLWVSGPRLREGAWATLMWFTGGCPLVSCGHTTASRTPRGSLSSLPAPRLLAQLVYGAKAETGAQGCTPHRVPWPCCPCNTLWGGKTADLQPEQQQAIEQYSNEFLVTEGPAGSGPWLLTTARRASWVAEMPSQGPGPGSSASRIPGKWARGTYAEGPSSAHSGSSQQPTASSRPGKEDQGTGISPQH